MSVDHYTDESFMRVKWYESNMMSISRFFRAFGEQSLIFYEGKQDPVVTEVEKAVRRERKEGEAEET